MTFTGTQLTAKRNVYTQNGNLGIAFDVAVSDPTAEYRFGVSGASGVFELLFASGHITQNGAFLHTYQPSERVYVECQLTSTTFNVSKNSTPLQYSGVKSSGDFNYLYASRQSSLVNADFNFYLSGANAPQYTVDQVGYYLSSGQTQVTGHFTNQGSYPIRVFSTDIQNAQGLSYTAVTGIGANSTGIFLYSGQPADYIDFDFTEPVLTTFHTNFNDVTVSFKIINAAALNQFVFLNAISDYGFNAVGGLNRNLSYSNFAGGFTSNTFNAQLSFNLSYVSGSGAFAVNGYVITTGLTASGIINQDGAFTGTIVTPLTVSGNSGVFSGALVQTGFIQGAFTGIFSGQLGTGSTGAGLITGPFTGFYTGFFDPALSGTYQLNGVYTGYSLPVNITGSGAIGATGVLDIRKMGYFDTLAFGFSLSGERVRYNSPSIDDDPFTPLFYESTGLALSFGTLSDPVFAGVGQLVTGVSIASGILTLSAITGGTAGNAISVFSLSGNAGTISGTNGVTGFGVTGLPFISSYSHTSGTIFLTGGEAGFATGFFFTTGTSVSTWYSNRPGYTGYDCRNGIGLTFITVGTIAAVLSGNAGYGVSGVVSGNGKLYLTATFTGASGNLISFTTASGTAGIITGSNWSGGQGNQVYSAFNTIRYNSYMTLQGGGGGIGSVIPPILFTGALNQLVTGSGLFLTTISGAITGVFSYTRTFTGNWELLTGLSSTSLVSCRVSGQYNSIRESGLGIFAPNSSMTFQVNHNQNQLNVEVARLQISGSGVVNPIDTLLYN